MYTDGSSEARNVQDEMFGERRLQQDLVNHRTSNPQGILQAIEQAVTEFHGNETLEDDLTLLAVHRD